MPLVLPASKYVDAIHGPVTKVTRRIDIYESDATTLWKSNVGFSEGSVSIDQSRQERRTMTCALDNLSGDMKSYPGGFWYDKVIKPFRGVKHADGSSWERQLGEFRVDTLDTDAHPSLVKVSCRDNTKLLLTSKFVNTTSFAANQPVENIIQGILVSGGVTRYRLGVTGKNTGRVFTFERGTERWKAIEEICQAYNLEPYFDFDGFFVLKIYADPFLGAEEYTFQTGVNSNIAAFNKKTSDTRIYNHILVTGESAETIPVWAEAKNTLAGSPTNIARLGQRLYQYTSSFITTTQQAQDVADRYLQRHALESFEVSVESIVVPYLEAGVVVGFLDPDPAPGDPTKYLLSSLDIPLKLGAMSLNVKRVRPVS